MYTNRPRLTSRSGMIATAPIPVLNMSLSAVPVRIQDDEENVAAVAALEPRLKVGRFQSAPSDENRWVRTQRLWMSLVLESPGLQSSERW